MINTIWERFKGVVMINLNNLFTIQKQLDDRITDQHNLHNQDLLLKKANALNCELWECMNESKMFKFWSIKKPDRDRMLEEYVDVIHFLLSIGNELEYTEHKYNNPISYDLNNLASGISNLITLIPEVRHKRHIATVFDLIIKLGYQLGFDEKEVVDAYMAKNEVNHIRQNSGVY